MAESMGQKVLIVDDEKEVRDLIAQYLKRENLQVESAADGKEALDKLGLGTAKRRHSCPYDLLVLDIMMDDINGFTVLEKLRAADLKIPVIFLTARKGEIDEVLGLGLGADDYVKKPFSPSALSARVKAHLRRAGRESKGQQTEDYIDGGPFRYDRRVLRVYKNEREIKLSARELKILSIFLENPDRIFTKQQLYERAWDDPYYDDNTVMVYIRHLRKKIEDDPENPRFIQTLRGLGYRFSVGENILEN